MTIAVCVRVHDGVVLAADSASTLVQRTERGSFGIVNVYNHADKIFNLISGLPVGAITSGVGSIGRSSMSTLAKDLRRRLSDRGDSEWYVDPKFYTIEEVAQKARRFLFEEKYRAAYPEGGDLPALTFKIAGYSAHSQHSETWSADIADGACPEPQAVQPSEDGGVLWDGEPEAIQRLLLGFGSGFGDALLAAGIAEADLPQVIEKARPHLEASLSSPPMPIQDAIDLAEFLVYTTIMFTRFKPGAPTVGGAIDLAAITRHEGFKWVRRKHYFPRDLNRGFS